MKEIEVHKEEIAMLQEELITMEANE